jgi:hypothetical protein
MGTDAMVVGDDMHFWANDDAVKLALGLRATLDRMKTER